MIVSTLWGGKEKLFGNLKNVFSILLNIRSLFFNGYFRKNYQKQVFA